MSNAAVGSNVLVWGAVLALAAAGVAGFTIFGRSPAAKVISGPFAQPSNGQKRVKVELNTGTGHLTVAGLESGTPDLARGVVQYLETQGEPLQTLGTVDGQAVFTLKDRASQSTGFRFPWEGCKVATEWQVHLTPDAAIDLDASTGGGNVKFDLSALTLAGLKIDSGGGNMDVTLPGSAAALQAHVRTGGGNVTVRLGDNLTGQNILEAHSGAGNVEIVVPAGVEARIHASSGLGKVVMDSRFVKVDDKTYQSAGFESAPDAVDISADSGAGNVVILVK